MSARFRLFAGPNGSGKTHVFQYLRSNKQLHTEIYLNADKIEREIRESLRFNFNAYRVKVSDTAFKKHIQDSGLEYKFSKEDISHLQIISGVLKIGLPVDRISSYLASVITTYLAYCLFETGQSFCFETVMSHPSKLELLRLARSKGYKTYLYYICVNNVELNVLRVKLRHLQGGHDVEESRIRDRYTRSVESLKEAVSLSDRAYIIDNSVAAVLIAEKDSGELRIYHPASYLIKYLS